MLARRALFQAVGVSELLHDLFIAAHRQPEHDLLPDGFAQQRRALKYLIAAQRNFSLCPAAQPRALNGNALSVDDAVAVLDAPAVDVPLRIGLRTLSGQLVDLRLHHAFDEDPADSSQQIP